MDSWYSLMLGHQDRHRQLVQESARERLVDSLSARGRTIARPRAPALLAGLLAALTVVLLRIA